VAGADGSAAETVRAANMDKETMARELADLMVINIVLSEGSDSLYHFR
jgi:phosphoribosyl-ATP pyrophosphohydrolase